MDYLLEIFGGHIFATPYLDLKAEVPCSLTL